MLCLPPYTQSHGAEGARRAADPPPSPPLSDGVLELPACRCRRWRRGGWCRRRGGSQAAGRSRLLGGERVRRQMRLQVPQLADHAHLRLFQALPGTGNGRKESGLVAPGWLLRRPQGRRRDAAAPLRGSSGGWRACGRVRLFHRHARLRERRPFNPL